MSDKTNQDNSVFHPSPRDTPMGDLTHWPVVPQPATDSACHNHPQGQSRQPCKWEDQWEVRGMGCGWNMEKESRELTL